MENNPLVPRQRNRRADRQTDAAQEPASVQSASAIQPMAPAQPLRPVQPVQQPQVRQGYGQQSYPSCPQQQAYAQTPRTMYQQPAAKPQQYAASQQPVQPQYSPRPRALKPQTPVNSGWQQPSLQDVPRARATQGLERDLSREEKTARREAAAKEKPVKKKLPRWLTWSTVLCFFLVLTLVTAYWLMQAYLVTEENRRAAARQATLNNYHITEQADGKLSVTWQEHIEKYAAQYNLQPAFVMAIIRNESSFRTNAESSVGARGLMQLMPDTAAWIADKLDDTSYTFDSMWDAETNIRYGCWYLNYLTKLFHGDPELISAAYHAGQTTITQWLSDRTKSSDGISLDLDKLSDGPTKQYIGRVTQTYGIYQTLLYPDEAFGTVPAGSDDAASQLR
nr:transglycosylase SLT domain-containing protein [Clostridia bacterium]